MSHNSVIEELKKTVKDYPNFPKEGIVFRDFLPILQKPVLFDGMISVFQDYVKLNAPKTDCIAGIESRGFLIGPSLAQKLLVPFIPLRKPGKLPGLVKKESYSLEYGSDALEIQCDALKEKQKIVIVDDLIATGGSMEAAVKLIRSVGADVELCLVVIELLEIKGKENVSAPVKSLLQF